MLESVLIVISCLLSLIIICLLIRLIILESGIRQTHKDITRIKTIQTNNLLPANYSSKILGKVTSEYNELLKDYRNLKVEIESTESELKNIIINISHDLRTPLTTILGYTQLLKESETSPKNVEYLGIIESRLNILKELFERLFEYSKLYQIEDIELSNHNITSILEESILIFHNDIVKKDIKLHLELLDQTSIKLVDKLALKRVFLNVISNALKYGKDDFYIIQTNDSILFKNKAINIDSIDVNKMFDRFFTIAQERVNGSMGLGLTICKILLNKMNLDIKAYIEDDYLILKILF